MNISERRKSKPALPHIIYKVMRLFNKILFKLKYHFNHKFFYEQWIIGIAKGDMESMIRSKEFDPEIVWLPIKNFEENWADPFIVKADDGSYDVYYEKFYDHPGVGSIWRMKINKDLEVISHNEVLDRNFHLSYPYIFLENVKFYIIPETAEIGKLSCYEYNHAENKIIKTNHLIDQALHDATILKHNGKYWVFGMQRSKDDRSMYESWVYHAEIFDGQYIPHSQNPVKVSLKGTRPAGDFIRINGDIYRPVQDCEKEYGKSIIINKLKKICESSIEEEYHMTIEVKQKKQNKRIRKIHTINVVDDVIIVDGHRKVFSLSKLFVVFKRWWRARTTSLYLFLLQGNIDFLEWVYSDYMLEKEILLIV